MSNTSEKITMTMDGKPVEYTRSDLVAKSKQPAGDAAVDHIKRPFVIARCTQAGVHAGYLVSRDSEGYVVLANARRIWCWDGAGSLSELAVYGASKPDSCKFGACVATQELKQADVCELIHCRGEGRDMICEQKEWRA